MSFDISEIRSSQVTGSMPAAAPGALRAVEASPTDDDGAVAVDTLSAAPPPEVQRAISSASDAYDQLEAGGSRLHFALNPATGRVTVQVHDLDGNVQSTITGSQAVTLAGSEQTN